MSIFGNLHDVMRMDSCCRLSPNRVRDSTQSGPGSWCTAAGNVLSHVTTRVYNQLERDGGSTRCRLYCALCSVYIKIQEPDDGKIGKRG